MQAGVRERLLSHGQAEKELGESVKEQRRLQGHEKAGVTSLPVIPKQLPE